MVVIVPAFRPVDHWSTSFADPYKTSLRAEAVHVRVPDCTRLDVALNKLG